jgi:hypothetical protein
MQPISSLVARADRWSLQLTNDNYEFWIPRLLTDVSLW